MTKRENLHVIEVETEDINDFKEEDVGSSEQVLAKMYEKE